MHRRRWIVCASVALALVGASTGCSSDRTAGASPQGSDASTEVPVTTVPVAPAPTPASTLAPLDVATSSPSSPSAEVTTTPTPDPTQDATPESTQDSAQDSTPAVGSSSSTGASAGAFEPASYPNVEAAVFGLALDNVAVSVSVHREGAEPWGMAAGRRADGRDIDSDTPFVTASVSKLVTALSIARLVEQGALTVDTVIPWTDLGLQVDPGWRDVTVRELLDHTSGMPINRKSWLDDPGPCSIPLQEALVAPPTIARTTWQYSNGNYCALGLLVEHLTGVPLDQAAYRLVFDDAGVTGPYLSTDGLRRDSVPSPRGVARLARLGGAGTWLASTDDLVAMLDSVTLDDLEVLRWPGIIIDQYGWGHTGTVDGAKACAWVLEDGRTTVAALVSGPKPATGGDVCDAVLPALALDLGIWSGDPARTPI